ncbi:AfsR/SARP family transcriptional regulator [Streptomyces sp. 3MP-14]|uniref:AfsR/SARP family transcriptional regulator n=1 Tax=Streptomyces mimosae TaxID=2586635 RepID=A0A5N6AIP1_9ACTN|nr:MULTISPECIES: NB-ARC domain-containing protein [Streptomyces]KAB8167886.1 AfsR/SARP family transcriptional regulator [Streptomyces mimosae]KAB8177466.1 AfsR/SARP family transcriptional regulator [Streptomyces sp. 3MP-14]
MDIRLLGLVRVLGDGGRVLPLTAPLTCATLAALALYPGEPVRTGELARQLWGPTPPEGAAGRLRRQVARLRAVLPRGAVRTLPGGYVLDVPPETTDVGRFAAALRRADALAPSRPEAALAALDGVLPLWTGNPLMGLPDCPLREVERGRLRLLWSRALRLRAEVELRLEEEAPAGGWARGDSPAAGPDARGEEETPGAAARLPEDGEAAAFAGIVERATAGEPPPAPAGLPAGIGTFVARAVELGRLRRRLTDASGAPAVCLIDGPGGVGKSTLAVRAARELAERFPDGLLYVDLRGADPRNQPLTVPEARRLLLAAMGTPGKEMPDEAGSAAVYHAELGQRRVLLLLDNAVDGAQVTPLLPTEGGSAALVTSRALLAGVPGALRLCLGTLAPDEAVALVRSIAAAAGDGGERGTAEEWAELVELCGRLPLALRIIGTRMAARPGWRVADFLGPLRDERRRMDELTGDDLDLRASLMVSIDQLAAGRGADERLAAALFPALGAAAVRSYTPGSVAALMDVTAREAGAALDRLADARIVDCPRPGVYTLHDLLRSAAAWAAARMPGEWHRDRLTALANWYAGSLYRLNLPMALSKNYRSRYQDGAARFPAGRPFTSVDEALPWADEVLDDVLALAEQLSVPDFDRGGQLAGAPLSHFAVESARALETYFGTRLAWSAQARLCELALTVARRRGDRFAEAVTLGQLGKLWGQRGQALRGAALLRYAITVLRSMGRTEEALRSTLNLVPCLGSAGRLAEAIGLAEETLAEVDAGGYDEFRIPLTNNLARCHLYLGDHDRARELLLANYAAAQLPWERTMAAGVLTEYHLEVAEYEEAVRWSERGMAHAAEQPFDPFVVAQQRTWRAEALRGLGEEASAHVEEMHAKAVIEDLNSRENSHLRVRITDRYLAG